jgi:hypothetical protein
VATIVDYPSLTQSIMDFLHRADVAAGLYTDYFIQGAQEKIEADVFTENWGNGVQWMENAYPATPITNGVAPVPSDWIAPKVMTVSDGSGDIFTLIFKAAAWIYDEYPIRQPEGLPAYIARDTSSTSSFPTYSNYLNFTATAGQTVFSTANAPQNAPILFASLAGQILVPGVDYTASASAQTVTLASGAVVGQVLLLQYPPYTNLSGSTTSSFIFGPYPDSSYDIQGTYYQKAPLLSNTNTTNWMVLNFPHLLHAACMIKAGEFLLDDTLIARWTNQYTPRLTAMVEKDKAERFAASTMQIELG